ncbi:Golgi localized Arf binding gamma-adaptin-like protein Gga21 [Schizosaccharomyces osmophilus]|uniref:Golgi localized Arf binding gamma-adaptin-like protein Gga21 n=1 Tax=Schizosaccharomyces osmophilus TaxID=2545709 RepID=A0AAF0AVS1_9SCHI|nr:Golgi localized Arf binding gamma-adaptin-like protein Gga21 [Schizosaccharomyces osmophilus]WBW72320.1 Golgi localized Arf binding gamma-adaptin-like protein Gga21 [Schizosaccharomyces osmophilus]
MLSSKVSRTLTRYIDRATDQFNLEPNLALNLEIADYINVKKGNAPREAAFTILKRINSTNPTVTYLALNLLDICVKNCGFPFHLQIGSQEFLNGFVSRFPKYPLPHMNKVQKKILEMLEEWNYMLCKSNRHSQDFSRIHDLRELMSFQGYKFPKVDEDSVAVMNPSNELRSAHELAMEDLEAHKAKLQELLRRGTPMDLAEANALMKVIAGYDKENTEDYSALASAEIESIKAKAFRVQHHLENPALVSLDEPLESAMESLKVYKNKVVRLLQTEDEDEYYVHKLITLNELLHDVLQAYGINHDFNEQPLPSSSQSSQQSNNALIRNESSLVDLLDESSQDNLNVPDNAVSFNNASVFAGFPDAFNSNKPVSNGDSVHKSFNVETTLPILKSDSLLLSAKLVSYNPASGTASYVVYLSNDSFASSVSNVTFQVAVMKSQKLQMLPLVGETTISPKQQNAAYMMMNISNIGHDQKSLRIRWRSYWTVNLNTQEASGESHLPLQI